MPSILDFLRLHNVFGGQQPSVDIYGNPVPPPQPMDEIPRPIDNQPIGMAQPEDEITRIFNQVYTPSHQASDAYNQMINNFPTPHKAGLLQKLGGIAAGIGYGPEGAREFMNAPYDREVNVWKAKAGPMSQAATQERADNTQERIAANEISTRVGQERKQAETERQNKIKNEQTDRKIDISEKRAKVYEFKNTHPDWKAEQDETGKLWFINPQDPTMKVDTGLDQITDMDKINLQVAGRLKAIDKQAGANKELESVRESNRQKDIAARGQQQRTTQAAKPTTSTSTAANKPPTPAATARDRVNKAQELLNQHPEWKKFITIDGTAISVAPVKSGWFGNGLDDKTRKDIMNGIYGDAVTSSTVNSNSNIPGTTQNTGQKMKVVDKASGKVIGMVPIGDVDKVDKTKYSVQVP